MLTGVFFTLAGDPALTSLSAVLTAGSTVFFGGTSPGNVVGGEWAYASGLNGAPRGANQGISSSGLGLFGAATFPGANLQGPNAVNGMQYGIVSLGDNPATGNAPVTGSNAFIHNAVVFTLGNLPMDFSLHDISNVSFQYGTSLTEPNFPGDTPVVPEPASFVLLGIGIAAFATRRTRKT
ncbi:MAG TPA: PEP-CTERM sorting domain-containing protein [Candidatus Hydrogenedentes bacterium]|nr:PEP-CTERM sorting domain-containing protein [Candidatus Hydrogenedentota bacterium]HOS02280.1 PEP-CTERM sorting domain-containing protein [Candidatus Hydrogenedentota bacterium]